MKKLVIFCVLSALLIFPAGCSDAGDTTDIRGAVTGLETGKGSVTILVEGKVEEDTAYDKASVTVTFDTSVFIEKDGAFEPADMGYIAQGDTVEVVFDGAVAESYPVQGRAKIVRILDGE